MLFQAGEVLVVDRIDFALADEHVFAAALHAGHRAIVIAHRLSAMLGRAFVFGAAIAVADLSGPGLGGKSGPSKQGEHRQWKFHGHKRSPRWAGELPIV